MKLNPRLVCHQLLTHEVHLVPEEMGNPPTSPRLAMGISSNMDKSWREFAIFRISLEEGNIYYIPINMPIQLLLMIPLISTNNF